MSIGETDPLGFDPHEPGAKLDNGKLRASLVLRDFSRALQAVCEVGTYGANKYTESGWLKVPNGQSRYEDAQERHKLKRWMGEEYDPETGLLHEAHEVWNALAKLELKLRERIDERQQSTLQAISRGELGTPEGE